MISINDLKKDTIILLNGAPHKVLAAAHMKKARQGATVGAKLKNLITGATVERTFNPAEKLEEAEVDKKLFIYIYNRRGEYYFYLKGDKSQRVNITEEVLGDKAKFLKENLQVEAEFFNEKIININLPIKIDYKVAEAPPAVKGNTQGAVTKKVKLENGTNIDVPIFIGEGDIVRVNTQKNEYVERVSKG